MEEQPATLPTEKELPNIRKISKKPFFATQNFFFIISFMLLAIGSVIAFSVAQQTTKLASKAAGSSIMIPVQEDATVNKTKPNKNFGTETELKVDDDKHAYLKFDLSSLSGQPITKATLRLYVTNKSTTIQLVKDVPSNNWNEKTITFTNKPQVGSVLAQISNTQLNAWKDIDLTPYITQHAGSIISLRVDTSTTGANNLYFAAKGRPNAPVLLIETAGATATTIPSPSTTLSTTPGATTQPPAGMRAIPDPIYGVTVDDVANVTNIVNSSKAFSRMPTTRIVFDEGVQASYYVNSVNQIYPSSYIMGELLDSEGLRNSTLQQYHDRMASYLSTLGNKVDIWEIGNEVNGNWTGPYPQVSAKIYDAYQQVEAAGKRSELTLWYNDGCGNGPSELDPIAFSQQYVPADMRNGLDYVFVSYYETECNNIRPTEAKLTAFFTQLHALYPNAKIGIGEIGFPNKVGTNTAAATSMINYYYGLKINVPNYVGGYFWWYYYEDMLPHTSKPLWGVLNNAFQKY